MNKRKLMGIMYENGDTQKTLAKVIGISLQRFNAKINENGGAEFTQSEIRKIKERYNLTSEDVNAIFLLHVYLKNVHLRKGNPKMTNEKFTLRELKLIDSIAEEYNRASERFTEVCASPEIYSVRNGSYVTGELDLARGLLRGTCAEYDLKIQNCTRKGETGDYTAAYIELPEERSQNGASVQRDLRNIRVILEEEGDNDETEES